MHSLLGRGELRYMNVIGYLEKVFLFVKELLCNPYLLSILKLCSMLTLLYMVCTSDLY
jgi:hypothetical protein